MPQPTRDPNAFLSSCLAKTRTTLLVEKRWRYLRYLHLHSAIERVKDEIGSVLAVGVGKGLAELALAVEFPHIQFRLTDIESPTTPSWSFVQRAVREWELQNVRFDILDITQPARLKADLVSSTEVLEHIEDAEQAARNMLDAADKYVFALVPFADRRFNADPERRRRVLESHGHFVCGFDEAALVALFPNPVEVRGCYWVDRGQPFRSVLDAMDAQAIRDRSACLVARADDDITPGRVPVSRAEAAGIWILAHSPGAH